MCCQRYAEPAFTQAPCWAPPCLPSRSQIVDESICSHADARACPVVLKGWLGTQELEGANLDVAMAQHLLVAADRFQLSRLRRICERRLCETVEVIMRTLVVTQGTDLPRSDDCSPSTACHHACAHAPATWL